MRITVVLAVLLVVALQGSAFGDALTDVREGNEAFRKGQYQLAADAFSRAVESGELTAEALAITYNNRGVALGELGDVDRAITDYRKALALLPDDETTLRNLRVAYLKRGMASFERDSNAEARADFDAAIKADPEHPAAYIKRGQLEAEAGELDAALADYRTALQLEPGNAELERVIGQIETAMNPPDRAPAVAAPAAPVTPSQDGSGTGGEVASATPEPQTGMTASGGAGSTTVEPAAATRSQETSPEPADEPRQQASSASGQADRQPAAAAATPLRDGEGELWRVVSAVYFRAGPGNEAERLGAVDGNVIVRVTGEELGWKHVHLPNGQSGYIYRKWLEPVTE
ncbi:MAG: tetratricopeptide repeat protein [Geminicoccaceae bacterium]